MMVMHEDHDLIAQRKETEEETRNFYPAHISARTLYIPHMWLAFCSPPPP